ncbi:hypothetical protein JCM11491_000398 [Sporobolomyces phaffii]
MQLLFQLLVLSSVLGAFCATPTLGTDPTTRLRIKYEKRAANASTSVSSSTFVLASSSSPSTLVTSTAFVPDSASASSVTNTSVQTATANATLASSTSALDGNATASATATATSSPILATPSSVGINASSTAVPPLPPTNATTGGAGSAQVIVVLQFAFLLETLEFELYEASLSKWSVADYVQVGYSIEQATIIIEQLHEVVLNEQSHVAIIQETILALGAQPFTGCGLSLDAALLDPRTFISTARTFETVGIAAYAGAAHLVSDLQILTALATILPVESRHSALLNTLSGGSLAPQSFETALSTSQVLAMIGGFLQAPNEPLSVVEAQFGSTLFAIGSRLVFALAFEVDLAVLFCQMIVGGSPAALVLPANACLLPPGINGPVAVYLTNSSTPLASNILVQASGQIVAGPSIIFVDAHTTLLASLFAPPELAGGSLYSVDMGGYWVAKKKGGETWAKATLVKTGSHRALL